MNYMQDLKTSYDDYNRGGVSKTPTLLYLSESLLDFRIANNYDLGEQMAYHALTMIDHLNRETVNEYIQSEENRFWFFLLLNTKFFADRVAWGGKENYGWDEDHKYVIKNVDMIIKGKNALDPVKLTYRQWKEFMNALLQFARPEMEKKKQRFIGKRPF